MKAHRLQIDVVQSRPNDGRASQILVTCFSPLMLLKWRADESAVGTINRPLRGTMSFNGIANLTNAFDLDFRNVPVSQKERGSSLESYP